MVFKRAFLAAAAMMAVTGFLGEAQAQLMGNDAWNYNRTSRGMHANVQAMKKIQQDSAGSGGGSGSGGGEANINYYINSSTTVGNINEISQTLSDGSTGYIGNNANQSQRGDQSSVADTSVTEDYSVNYTEAGTSHRHHGRRR